ncbi:MAG TPA: hypothetical protein VNH84_03045, partial [Candidatus Saccharimonadales bacterium]|nr:hypothetical protein [Candidatus Saccharimonadales bacterium]
RSRSSISLVLAAKTSGKLFDWFRRAQGSLDLSRRRIVQVGRGIYPAGRSGCRLALRTWKSAF